MKKETENQQTNEPHTINRHIEAVKEQDSDCRYISYIIDGMFGRILLHICLWDFLVFKRFCPFYSQIPNNSFVVVVALMPCVVTIVSLLLSINKDKIYGATIADINSMRGPAYFTLFHNVLVSCSVIVIHSLFVLLDLRGSLWSLEIIAAIYAFIFVLQQLPIMMRSRTSVKRILRDKYLTKNPNDSLFTQVFDSTFEKMIVEIIFEEGMETAYCTLKTPDRDSKALLDYLLEGASEYLRLQATKVSERSNFPLGSDEIEHIVKIVKRGYANVRDLLDPNSKDTFKSELTIDKYYQFTNMLFALHTLCLELKLEGIERTELRQMLSNEGMPISESPEPTLKTATIVAMLATTLNSGETWFVSDLKDSDRLLDYLFDFKGNSIGVFASMLIHHTLSNVALSDEEERRVNDFLNEPQGGMYSNGTSWRHSMQRSLESSCADDVIKSISSLLALYESTSDIWFRPLNNGHCAHGDGSSKFTKKDLFHDWLLLVFGTLAYGDASQDLLKNVMNQLNVDDKNALIDELSERWLLDGEMRKDVNCTFLKFYEGDETGETSADWVNEPLAKELACAHGKYCKVRYESKYSPVSDKELEKAGNEILNSFEQSLKKCKFYDPELSVDNKITTSFQLRVSGEYWRDLLKAYLEQMPTSLGMEARRKIEIKASSVAIITADNPDVTLDKIKALGATHTSSRYWRVGYLTNKDTEIKKKMAELGLQYVSGIPLQLFWKKGAIKFNAKIDESQPLIRPLTLSEIEEVIRNEYRTVENGLYRYCAVQESGRNSFYVTKDELAEIIKNTNFNVRIVFWCDVSLDSDGLLVVDKKYDWGQNARDTELKPK